MPPPCFSYKVYGFQVCSDRPVLEFEPLVEREQAEIYIRRQEMDVQPVYDAKDWHFDIGAGEATLCFKGVGVFHIQDASTILVQAEYGADERMVERYLSGVVFAALLHLRGLVVYHASSVAINEREAVVFIGESGAGKSTLSALMHLRGFSCITDDVSPVKVDSQGVDVIPGYPRLKIDPALASQHNIPANMLSPVHSSEEQIYLSLSEGFRSDPLSLRALFFLEVAPQLALRKITAREAMIQTVRHTLPSRLLNMTGSREHFLRCSAIAGSVPAYTLSRTDDISSREQLADMVVAELFHGL
jgi:hypothetical protein